VVFTYAPFRYAQALVQAALKMMSHVPFHMHKLSCATPATRMAEKTNTQQIFHKTQKNFKTMREI
jgi:hypothetical protein